MTDSFTHTKPLDLISASTAHLSGTSLIELLFILYIPIGVLEPSAFFGLDLGFEAVDTGHLGFFGSRRERRHFGRGQYRWPDEDDQFIAHLFIRSRAEGVTEQRDILE